MSQEAINFKKFFNTLTDFLFILDMQGNIIEMNDAVVNILGYSREDLTGQSILTVHPAIFREKAREIVGEMIAGRQKFCRLPLISKTNAHFLVETKVYETEWNSEKALIGISRNLLDIPLTEGIFQEVFDSSPVLTVITELDSGMIIYVNKPFVNTLGYSQSEAVGKRLEDLQIFHDYYQRLEIKRKIEKHESIKSDNVVFQARSGELLHCMLTASKVEIQSHAYLFTFLENITEVKVAEAKLRHNLRQQTLLADISKSLQMTQNLGRTVNQILKLLGEHTGVSRVYIFEDDPTGALCNNTFEWCNRGIEPQINNLQGVPYEIIPSWKPMLEKDGRIFSTNIYELPGDLVEILAPQAIKSILIYPLYVKKKFFGFIGFDECTVNKVWEQDELELLRTIANFLSNTYERNLFQDQLAESEAQIKMAIENTQTGLWDWNIVTGAGYYNETWCSMLGYTSAEIAPHVSSWEKLVHPDDMPRIQQALQKHMNGETEIYESTHRLKTKSGNWKWVMDRGRIIERDAAGAPVRAIGTHTDVDSLKNIESEYRIANAANNKFFSVIARELRDPVGALSKLSELGQGSGKLNEKTITQFLNSISEISGSKLAMLDNLFTWAELKSEQISLNPRNTNLNQIISESLESFKSRAAEKDITVNADLTHQFSVKADVNTVKTVFRNLLSNAVKFTHKNGSVNIKMSNLKEEVKIEISDTGVSIPKDKIDIIFSPDTYYSTPGTENETGEGLGLKLCKDLISLNGGNYFIISEAGKGTVFTFTLPQAD